MVPTAAHCATHQEAVAVEACVRCGGFICVACINRRRSGASCAACLPFVDAPNSMKPLYALVAAATGPGLFALAVLFSTLMVVGDSRPGGFSSGLIVAGLLCYFAGAMAAFVLLMMETADRQGKRAKRVGYLFQLAWIVLTGDVVAFACLVIGAVYFASA